MGTAREKHLFQFNAKVIAEAAAEEAKYHQTRLDFWKAEFETAVARVKATATIEVREWPITGGMRAECVVNYGDPSAYKRMQEASEKIDLHRKAIDKFLTEMRVYGTQGVERVYELDAEDVHYFRLGGEARPE